jgi:vitamin B12 transporter
MEGGIQVTLLKGVLDVRAVYFNREIKNVIIYGPSFTMVNLDKQKDHGLEIEPTLYIGKKLTLKVFYAYVDGKVTTQNNGKDSTYSNLIRRPKHSVGVNIGYQVTPHFYVSTQLSNYSKRSDLFYNMATYAQEPVTLSAYTLWNAYAEYAFLKNHLRLFADLKNITGTKFTEVYGYSTMRFNMMAGLRITI